jgi:hypothetical protein
MRPVRPLSAALAIFAIALVSAAVGNSLTETISNTGIFGSGFRDDNHGSVATVLIAGLGIGLLWLATRICVALGSDGVRSRARLRNAAAGFAQTSGSRHLAAVYGLQIAIVDAMERGEQFLAHGPSIRGFSWLGGPVPFALVLHLLVCATCMYVAGRLARALLARVMAAIHEVFDRLLAAYARDFGRSLLQRSNERFARCCELLAHRRIRGRAPPLSTAFA